ncbi:ABC transporter ATP-binding protein [Collinsella sp. zg1085]|uniref:ABC transporter ATP-binding protein n=1 Tax=Collinsella sp. zg1085 TaxID=2844380 RepID=UPI001C0B1F91|nr:ABC transporter ATP-binding protein [Collinsella sp. zg1085]QWT17155.1 ABC transporter ATP-binding protein [Collinsella sp. zg1085]
MSVIQVEHLSRIYGTGATAVCALDDVSFTITSGEFVVIVGSSGSGKSTLLHLMGGVDRPDYGRVLVDGQDIYQRSDEELAIFRRRDVGLVYQFYNLIPVLNVIENIGLPVRMDGREPHAQFLNELIETLGLTGKEHMLPHQLSGGQQQRVAIARALLNTPSIILADEPTGNLDSKNSAEIMMLLRECNRRYKQTLVVITHDEDIALMADRVLSLADGQLVSDTLRA